MAKCETTNEMKAAFLGERRRHVRQIWSVWQDIPIVLDFFFLSSVFSHFFRKIILNLLLGATIRASKHIRYILKPPYTVRWDEEIYLAHWNELTSLLFPIWSRMLSFLFFLRLKPFTESHFSHASPKKKAAIQTRTATQRRKPKERSLE